MKLKRLHTSVAGINLLRPLPLFLEAGKPKPKQRKRIRRCR
jgi:hypothetical protein